MRIGIITSFLIIAACATPAPPPPTFFGLEGAWRGTGTFQGMPSNVAARFEPATDGDWTLDLEVVAARPGGEPTVFTGHARYAMAAGNPASGAWFDSLGSTYSISPRIENGVLIVDWGPEAPVRGRSEYRLQDDGDLQIEDFAPNRNGDLRRFATAELNKEGR